MLFRRQMITPKYQGSPDPNDLSFWRQRLLDRTILQALKNYPEQARKIFGPLPSMRGDFLELGLILGAREILATPAGSLVFEENVFLNQTFQRDLETLPEEQRGFAEEFLSEEKQEETVRKLARNIIWRATGFEPSS